jgi:UDP:flavonoid glycosyltransferase YjiC (YdhE family)
MLDGLREIEIRDIFINSPKPLKLERLKKHFTLRYIDGYKDYITALELSDFVLTHGGIGSIIEALDLGKKVLAIAN